MTELLRPRESPCRFCPYRKDCPPGVWAPSEYRKLPDYDGTTGEQAEAGAFGVFCCHASPDKICAGWCGCHDMDHNLAIRVFHGLVDIDAVRDYHTDVPLFGSGAEAAEHGMSGTGDPPPEAVTAAGKIERLRAAIGDPVKYREPGDDD
jgi:hypothetical protein